MERMKVYIVAALMVIAMVECAEMKPKADCEKSEAKLAACAAAVIGPNPPSPTKECCDGLRSTTPQEVCACKLMANATAMHGFNPAAAKAMPLKCNISLPAAPPPKCKSFSLF